MSRTNEDMISIFERKNLRCIFLEKFRKMERGEEDQISISVNHIMNLIFLTSSKYDELIGQARMNEDRTSKTAFSAKPISTRRRDRPNHRSLGKQPPPCSIFI
ncbi:hypothetical protein TNCV_322451 [Trichonephila clavipes]|nr:hypothetical protein TNCV_322451 [Trichonephila clavipes]